jgi:hypothetical protein
MALITIFARLIEMLTYKSGVSINVYWVIQCVMVILGPIVRSLVINDMYSCYMGSIRLIEPIDYKCVIWSSTIGTFVTMVDAWGASISTWCLIQVIEVGVSPTTKWHWVALWPINVSIFNCQIVIIPKF